MRHTRIVAVDHLSLPVRDLRAARNFYAAALGAIGMKINLELADSLALGSQSEKVFWLVENPRARGEAHFAFRVENREEVDAFHAAAILAGGEDNGAPGLRPDYGKNYYAAFAFDPERNNIEVVCYAKPEKAPRTRRS